MSDKLTLRNVDVSFGKKQVIEKVSLNVPDRKIMALIGPSGSGKSVLLRSINRMHDLEPSAKVTGEFLLDGRDVYGRDQDVVDIRRKIGMVFQRPNPFPKSIFDNIAYGLKLSRNRKKEEIRHIVEESLKGSYLWDEVKDDLDRSALRMSGGQQQRLCIARTIAVQPEVILMDEPCSALDPISTAKIEELMLEIRKEFCIVIVTHNMQQAQRIADETAVMYLGKMVEHGSTDQIFNNPQNEITQHYIQGAFG